MAFFGHFGDEINKLAQTRLGDVLTGGVARAANRNDWRMPGSRSGNEQTSWDDLAAVGTGNSSLYRNVARGVGAGFGAWGLGTLFGGGAASSGSGSGATQVGEGFPLAEEAGGSGADGGQLSGPTGSGSTLSDLLSRYGRQGANALSRMGGTGTPSSAGVPAADNSLIAPTVPTQTADANSGMTPQMMALLLAAMNQRGGQQIDPQMMADYQPSMGGGGLA